MNHNFNIVNADTDSISFCKPNGQEFTEIERKSLIEEINKISPEFMIWGDDGLYSNLVCLKAKNYIMRDKNGKVKLKGSSLKSSTLQPALKLFLNEIITSILDEKQDFICIYNKFVLQIMNITDIKPWCSKKTLSKTTYESKRENEAKIIRAIEGSDYVEGDKVYVFYGCDDELILCEHFKGYYNKQKLLKALYNCTDRFSTVLDCSQFINYSLKTKQKDLDLLLGLITQDQYDELKKPKKKSK